MEVPCRAASQRLQVEFCREKFQPRLYPRRDQKVTLYGNTDEHLSGEEYSGKHRARAVSRETKDVRADRKRARATVKGRRNREETGGVGGDGEGERRRNASLDTKSSARGRTCDSAVANLHAGVERT